LCDRHLGSTQQQKDRNYPALGGFIKNQAKCGSILPYPLFPYLHMSMLSIHWMNFVVLIGLVVTLGWGISILQLWLAAFFCSTYGKKH
jgi:hypothetical protein